MVVLLVRIVLYGLDGTRSGRRNGGGHVHETILLLVPTEQRVADNAVVENETYNYDREYDGDDAECRDSCPTVQVLLWRRRGCSGGGRLGRFVSPSIISSPCARTGNQATGSCNTRSPEYLISIPKICPRFSTRISLTQEQQTKQVRTARHFIKNTIGPNSVRFFLFSIFLSTQTGRSRRTEKPRESEHTKQQ